MTFRGPDALIRWTTLIGTAATAASLIFLYLEYSGRLAAWDPATYVWVDTALSLIMMGEWFILFIYVDDRRAYARARWIDLLASIPLLLVLRPLRIVRLIRLLRLLRGAALLHRAAAPWKSALDTAVLKSVAAAAAVTILVCSLMVWDLERGNPDLNEFREVLWWAIVTATTVGYGDRVPQGDAARFVAVILMVLGIGLIGTLAATLTSALTAGVKRPVTNEEVLEEVRALRRELAEMRSGTAERTQI
jgi:voltage-gated potassium channel